jgi:hypothetical protein
LVLALLAGLLPFMRRAQTLALWLLREFSKAVS